MSPPENFSWVDKPRLAAHAIPHDAEELAWLRQQGIELVVSLTEEPLRRDWLSDASLLSLHVPIEDMEPPSQEQIQHVLSAIRRANERNMGVSIHCHYGRGRTGTLLACYLVEKGMGPREAIRHVRKARPRSIETTEQEEVVEEFARSLPESQE